MTVNVKQFRLFLPEKTLAQNTENTARAFSMLGIARWLNCETGRPNQTPSRKDRGGVKAKAALSRKQQLLE